MIRCSRPVILAVFVALSGTLVAQEEGGKAEVRRKVKRLGPSEETYIGVVVEPVPAALVAHLPSVLERNRGVIVTRLVPGSPAADAPLRRYDILLAYDGHAISAPEQLRSLVLAGAPRRSVRLDVVRAGRALAVDLTTGLRPAGGTTRRAGRGGLTTGSVGIVKTFLAGWPPSPGSTITISLVRNRLRVQVTFSDRGGATRTRRADGSRDQILRDLDDLPPKVKAEVRRRLDETISFEKSQSLVSFRMRPFLDARGEPRVRVTVWYLGEAGKVKTNVFDAAPDVEAIARGLGALRPPVREQLVKALRRAKIPRLEVEVDESL